MLIFEQYHAAKFLIIVVINVGDDFMADIVIAGAVIRIQRLKSDGEPGNPAGHFDTTADSGWKTYCCATSKFYVNIFA